LFLGDLLVLFKLDISKGLAQDVANSFLLLFVLVADVPDNSEYAFHAVIEGGEIG
jgi:hypothetical protein